MKAILSISLFLGVSLRSFSQGVSVRCNLIDSCAYKYVDDACRLAIRHTFRVNGTYKDSGMIDQQLRDRYLKALIAVYNSTNIPARDTVISWLNIHTLSSQPTLREFGIQADSNLIWMKNFRNNVIPCGQATIDAVMQKYGMQKTHYSTYPFGSQHLVRLNASFNFNSLPVGVYLMQQVPGISLAGSFYSGGDGIDIWDSLNVNFVELVYYYRWGDCIAGCMYYKYWIFRVYNDCTVEYRGTQQNRPLPPWASLPTERAATARITVSPNPATNSIEIKTGVNTEFTIDVLDISGRNVIHTRASGSAADVNISELPPGPYVLRLLTNEEQSMAKFIKQ